MKIHCRVIRDLLPLYVEGLASPESRELVEQHLTDCPECRQKLTEMSRPQPQVLRGEAAPLKGLKRVLLQHTLSIVMVAVFFTVAAMILLQGLFFVKPHESFAFVLICFYLILPMTSFVCSLVLGLGKSAVKWFAPLLFGGVGVLLPMIYFESFEFIALFFALIPSLLGLGIGSIVFIFRRARDKKR